MGQRRTLDRHPRRGLLREQPRPQIGSPRPREVTRTDRHNPIGRRRHDHPIPTTLIVFELMAARPADRIPEGAGWVMEPKYDGYRVLITRSSDDAQLTSRRGTDLTEAFPEASTAAVAQVPDATLLDGELVAYIDGRLNFDTLQHRMTSRGRRATAASRTAPATLMIFDILISAGRDLRMQPWTERRAELEAIAAGWRPPMQLTPYTDDPAEAAAWMEALAPMGIEGVVAKRATARYGTPGSWLKVKHRETLTGVVGAVIGVLAKPEALIVGQWSPGGELNILGRTSPLSSAQSAEIGALLTAPDGHHPWPSEINSGHFGGGPVRITHVNPTLHVEVLADVAQQSGRRRHALRFLRVRLD